ncbi:hypothetical protein AB4099_27640 [Bosea sp. 2KB_26]|uniref:hypothetical protein n=1 Tax=Bosea sp. 2KB_26 TaxID=3237475 RepID=UPI003F8F10FA
MKPVPYDPAQAKKLLANDRARNPNRALSPGFHISQVVASQLGEIGVTVNLREIEFGAWMNKYGRESGLRPPTGVRRVTLGESLSWQGMGVATSKIIEYRRFKHQGVAERDERRIRNQVSRNNMHCCCGVL